MTADDVTERAARVINETNWKADFKGGARADEIAQALADTGLLATEHDLSVDIKTTATGQQCTVKHTGVTIFKGVSLEATLTTEAHDRRVAARALREAADKFDRDRRIHDTSCGESPAQTREQAGRDYGVTTGLRRAVRHLNERADRIERGD